MASNSWQSDVDVGLVLESVVDPHDVRVIQLLHDLNLRPQLVHGDYFFRASLHGMDLSGGLVGGLVDSPEGATTELVFDGESCLGFPDVCLHMKEEATACEPRRPQSSDILVTLTLFRLLMLLLLVIGGIFATLMRARHGVFLSGAMVSRPSSSSASAASIWSSSPSIRFEDQVIERVRFFMDLPDLAPGALVSTESVAGALSLASS
eukprot:CAMPEP_0180527622 /NCGR_PEP_ID=MMETSP1036_2-20121128/60334_1 /TAXON_ID=632150 /ORGANISM="Azadinium spinosum, Strain 3D9" /LENGTH=206 /DNA_ID=CAMNT_0022541069 /DNA_START=134 /DNA_END=752 /DNA_ORIENTATION=-